MLTKILKDHPEIEEALLQLAAPYVKARKWPDIPPLKAPPKTAHYTLIGTAFDYFLRWEIQRRNPVAEDRVWVAESAIEILDALADTPIGKKAFTPELAEQYRAVVREAKEFVTGTYLPSRDTAPLPHPVRHAAYRYALCLAKVDPLLRSGTIDPTVVEWDPLDVLDLETLDAIAPWDYLAGDADEHRPILNPSFGEVSKLFQGADADLVVGSTLLDFKATKYFDLVKHLPQLLGYVMIGTEYSRNYDPNFPIFDEAGIYFARHGIVETFSLVPIVTDVGYEKAREMLWEAAASLPKQETRTDWVGAK